MQLQAYVSSIVIIKMAKRSRANKYTGIGCGYLMKMTVLISFLMIANSYLVGRLVASFMSANNTIPDIFNDVRLYQFFQIFVPILLVCLQFWIYDRLMDRWFREQM